MHHQVSAPEEPKTLTAKIYKRLRNDIINGVFPPDSKLKIEHLRREYDVGATPVREALSALSSSGFILAEGQRGFKVAPVSVEDLEDITEMRVTLELIALRKSILIGDDRWESQVVASYYQLSKLETSGDVDNVELWDERNRNFHQALISACRSKWLMSFHSTLYDQHKRYRNISLSDKRETRNVHAEHHRIYEAAIARDADTACKETETHLRLTANITIQVLQGRAGFNK